MNTFYNNTYSPLPASASPEEGSLLQVAPLTIAATLLFASFLFFGRRSTFASTDKHGNTIPKGPLGLPILGSFPFMTHYPELTLDKWAKKFGDLYSVWLGNQLFVIVSSPTIAKDLLVTNGSTFSSRKELYMKHDIVLAGRSVTATPYNELWKKHRRIATMWLNQKMVNDYSNVLDLEATDMNRCMLEASQNGRVPVNPQPFAGRCSLNNMLTIVFGIRADSVDHPLVAKALHLSREFMNLTGPMSNLIDYVPALQYLPSDKKTRGHKLFQGLVDTYGGMVEDIRKRMESGEDVPNCLSKTMIELQDVEGLDLTDMAMLCSAFMIGGVETTASLMQWFSAHIPAYPDMQRRAQEELDRVVGRDRLPQVEDEKDLPYCRAIIKEVERCHNPFWLGTPHVSSDDFTYKGSFIPKGTVVVLNTWTMHHDPNRHADPDSFNPEHYLTDSLSSAQSSNLTDPNQRDHWMFGAGRRICPAIAVAERELFLSITRMLWSFNMEAAGPIDLKEYDGESGRSPVPFEVYLKPRHENVEGALKEAMLTSIAAEIRVAPEI